MGDKSDISHLTQRVAKDLTRMATGGKDFVEGGIDMVIEFKPITQLVIAAAGLMAIFWAFMIEVGDSDVAVEQGENYFPFKVTLLQSFMGVLGIMLLVLVFAGALVKCFSKDKKIFDLQDSNFDKAFNIFVVLFEKHVTTLLFVGALFAVSDTGQVYFSNENSYLTMSGVLFALAAVARLLLDKQAVEVDEKKDLFEADIERNQSWLGPFVVTIAAVFAFNEANDNGFSRERKDGDWSKDVVQALLILDFVVSAGAFSWFPKLKELSPTLQNFASYSVFGLLAFSAIFIGDNPSEAAIISLMGIGVLDIIRVDFGMKGDNDDKSKTLGSVSRGAHFLVGIAAFVLIGWGMGATEEISFGDNLQGSLSNSTNLNVELPAAAKIMRDVAFVSAVVKILGVFYLFDMSNGQRTWTPLQRFSSENTLRQMSTLGLLISSSFVWAYPIVEEQTDEARDSGLQRFGVGLFALAIIARLADAVADYNLHKGKSNYLEYYCKWYGRAEDKNDESSIEKGTWDNPRTWLVVAALATSLGLLVEVRNKEDFPEELSDYDHRDTVLELAFAGVIVHLIVAVLQPMAKLAERTSDQGDLTYCSLSRSPFIRLLVTTFVLTMLTMLVAESGFAGEGKDDKYGLLKNKIMGTETVNVGSEGVGDPYEISSGQLVQNMTAASTEIVPKYDTLVVSENQWNAVGALVAYIVADLVGHVFL